jgi:hypothetical protein
LQSHTNLRTDQYGGSIANRARLLLEIVDAAIGIWGADRVAVRLSPYGVANGSGEPDPMPLYGHVISALDALGLAYLHFIEPRSSGGGRAEVNHQNVPSAMQPFRPLWRGVLISAGGFDGASAVAAVAAGHADAIAFGRISSPIRICRRGSGMAFRSRPITARPSMAARRPDIPITRFMTSCREHSRCERRRPSNPDRGSSRQQRIKRSRGENFTVVCGDGDLPSLAGKNSRLRNRNDQAGPLAFHRFCVAFCGYFVGHQVSPDCGQLDARLVRRFDRNPPTR